MPPRALSLPVSAALAALWIFLRAVVFADFLFPLTYVLPLLVCVWSRDRVTLWGMAAVFATVHTVSQSWIIRADVAASRIDWATYAATLINIFVAAIVVHAIIALRERAERSLAELRAQSDVLRAQGDELASQNEELTSQSEELAQQNERLAAQSEELARQNAELLLRREENERLAGELARRVSLQQTLLEATRLSGDEHDALERICDATLALFGDPVTSVVMYDRDDAGRLVIRASAGGDRAPGAAAAERPASGFVALALEERRTAALDDASLRPDLAGGDPGASSPVRAVLCAPMLIDGVPYGAIALYSDRPHQWTDEEFRLANWLAYQAARVLQTLRLQDHLRHQAEALRESDRRKNEFLATLSHELRNPLAPIRYALQLLDRPVEPGHPAPRDVIERQVRHLARLVDDLLDATRVSSNKIQLRKARIDLVPLVRDAVAGVRTEMCDANQVAEVSLPPASVWLDADADRLMQVLTNLLNNATRYTPNAGRIRVEARVEGEQVALTIADNGVGLDRADLSRVFDMFTQVGGPGAGGLGIGLALVKGIVELHGGTVEARSDGIGHGATFVVRLPIAAAAPEPAVEQAGPHAVSSAPRRVLVVDDNQDAADMMATLLAIHGHAVRVACDGRQALALAAAFRPDVALLDIGLPGLSGYDVARQLRANPKTRRMRLIAVTGWGQEADQQLARESGFDAHLTKPADPDRIAHLVAEVPETTDDVEPA